MADRDREIEQLVNRLRNITLEATAITDRLRELQQEPRDRQLQIDDEVVITNNYLGQRGVTGTVRHLTAHQVTLEDSNGRFYTRGRQNVRLLPPRLQTPRGQ